MAALMKWGDEQITPEEYRRRLAAFNAGKDWRPLQDTPASRYAFVAADPIRPFESANKRYASRDQSLVPVAPYDPTADRSAKRFGAGSYTPPIVDRPASAFGKADNQMYPRMTGPAGRGNVSLADMKAAYDAESDPAVKAQIERSAAAQGYPSFRAVRIIGSGAPGAPGRPFNYGPNSTRESRLAAEGYNLEAMRTSGQVDTSNRIGVGNSAAEFKARQDLMRGNATPAARAYAKKLIAMSDEAQRAREYRQSDAYLQAKLSEERARGGVALAGQVNKAAADQNENTRALISAGAKYYESLIQRTQDMAKSAEATQALAEKLAESNVNNAVTKGLLDIERQRRESMEAASKNPSVTAETVKSVVSSSGDMPVLQELMKSSKSNPELFLSRQKQAKEFIDTFVAQRRNTQWSDAEWQVLRNGLISVWSGEQVDLGNG